MTTLQNSAMLVALNVRQWTARRFDRTATKEVDEKHGAKDAGRFNKLLIDKGALEPIDKIENSARTYHYSVTLPWGDQGQRILPAALFMDYTQSMDQFKREFESRVRDFLVEYPRLMQEARNRLGSLYDPQDYPDAQDIRTKFEFGLVITPIPSAQDFRVQLNEEYVDQIKADLMERQNKQQIEAVRHVWQRVREVVERIKDTCSKEKPRIYDSMMDNAKQLIEILPALNLAGDPQLDKLAEEMKQLVVSTDVLRANAHRRDDVAKAADALLAKFSWGQR